MVRAELEEVSFGVNVAGVTVVDVASSAVAARVLLTPLV